MINSDKTKITAPISIEDVRQVLVDSSRDLGTLCKSEKINMWAKYKPICGAFFSQSQVGDTFSPSSGKWLDVDTSEWGRPWYLGTRSMPMFGIKAISTDNDIISQWVYNKPYGGTNAPYRLTDFAGYSAEADCAYIYRTQLPTQIDISGATYKVGVYWDGQSADEGGLSIHDCMRLLADYNNNERVYLGCRVEYKHTEVGNNRQGEITAISANAIGYDDSGVDDWSNGDGCTEIEINVTQASKGANVNIMGKSFSIFSGDEVKIALFLVPLVVTSSCIGSPNETYDELSKYSANANEYCATQITMQVGLGETKIYNVRYSCSINANVTTLNDAIYYKDDDGSIYKATKILGAMYGNIQTQSAAVSYNSIKVYVGSDVNIVGTDGNTYQVSRIPQSLLYNEDSGSLNNAKTITINGSGVSSFVGYTSYNDAQWETNGTTYQGAPIADEILYNNNDAAAIGIVSGGNVNISMYAVASNERTAINLFCDDSSNVIRL